MYISDHVYQCQLRSCSVLKFRSYTGVKQTKITTSSGKFIFIDHAHYIQGTPSLQSHTMLCSRTVASLSKHWSDVPVCVVIFALFIWVELIVTALYTNVNFLYQRFDSDATGIIVNQVTHILTLKHMCKQQSNVQWFISGSCVIYTALLYDTMIVFCLIAGAQPIHVFCTELKKMLLELAFRL